jgi:mannosyltransferase OCH1-like enzyme
MNGEKMSNNTIPKIIHIMWIGHRQPPQECIDSWWAMHPGWTHMFWNDTKVAEFEFQNQHAIDQSQFISGKVNIMRYEILKHFGGVFIDADALCLKPLDEGDFLDREAFSCYINENLSLRVANGYMGFITNYPLLDELIERISNLPDSEFNPKRNNSWLITGPEFLRKTIEETADLIHLYPSVTFCPVHHSGVRAENWKETEIFSLQYWNSTHRTEGSKEKRKILDDALLDFLRDHRELNAE